MILNKVLHWFGYHLRARLSEIEEARDEDTERNTIAHTLATEQLRSATSQTIIANERLRGSILRMKAYADLEFSLQQNANRERPTP